MMNKLMKNSKLEFSTHVGEIITLIQPHNYIIMKFNIQINSELNLSIVNDLSLIPISIKYNVYSISCKVWINNRKFYNYPVQLELIYNQGFKM